MFATLLGSLPRPPLPDDASPEALLAAVVRAQEVAGLEPISDAGFGIGDSPAERWRVTAGLTDRPVKQTMVGPYSAGLAGDRAGIAALRAELSALVGAGCPYVEIHEPAAIGIDDDEAARGRFRDAHLGLLDGVSGAHLSLAITGGSADAAGIQTFIAAPYASLAVDLIDGPDNWRLVAATAGDRGIVCGALSIKRDADDRPEILLWAADYAASTGGRGTNRVGLATAGSLAGLTWDVAVRKLGVLGEAARLADQPPADRRKRLDPRAVDIRSAALGQVMSRNPSPRRGRRA
jgi:hypothetical protein